MFESLLGSNKSPLCVFLTRKACQEFNSHMLSRLDADITELPYIDEVDETASTYKWNKRATEEIKKLNSDCNLMAGLEAVLQVAVGARVMLCRNIDNSKGLVNGTVGLWSPSKPTTSRYSLTMCLNRTRWKRSRAGSWQ